MDATYLLELTARKIESCCRCEAHWKQYGRQDPNCQAHDLAGLVREDQELRLVAELGPPHQMDAPDGPRCRCGQPSTHESGWCGKCRSEPELREQVEALLRVLDRVQWCPDDSKASANALTHHPDLTLADMGYCQVCRRRKNAGHASDCLVGMALKTRGERTLTELDEQRLRVRIAGQIEEMSIPLPIDDWMGTKKDLTAKLALAIAKRVREGDSAAKRRRAPDVEAGSL